MTDADGANDGVGDGLARASAGVGELIAAEPLAGGREQSEAVVRRDLEGENADAQGLGDALPGPQSPDDGERASQQTNA